MINMSTNNLSNETLIKVINPGNGKNRYKNPWFWLGILGVFFAAIGVSIESLTSWQAFGSALYNFISNPFLIISAAFALAGVFTNPTTKGIKD